MLMIAKISESILAEEATLNELRIASHATNIQAAIKYEKISEENRMLMLIDEQIARVEEMSSQIEEFKQKYSDVM